MYDGSDTGLLPYITSRDRASIDVGANEGRFVRALLPLSREVHCFEPIPAFAAALARGFAGEARVVCYPCAVSDRFGVATLRIPDDRDQQASIEPANALPAARIAEVQVITCTLDSLELSAVGCIKIDVEGHELAVLKGAAALLARDRPALLIEIEERHCPGAFPRVVAHLAALGYAGCFWDDAAGRFLPVGRFVSGQHQDLANLNTPRYTNNFVFSTSLNRLLDMMVP